MSQLADWKCHKIVKAGKVISLNLDNIVAVEDADGAECNIEMPMTAFSRGAPAPGDYIVIYEDGYKSWSPAKAFEEGYTRL